MIQRSFSTTETRTERRRKQTDCYQKGKGWGEINQQLGIGIYQRRYKTDNQQGPAVQHRGLCSILCNNLMVPRERDGGRDSQGVWDGYGHTALSNMENQQGPAGQHRGFCSVSCGSLDGREVWRRMDPCLCMAEPLCCPPETITTQLIGYTPIQNKNCCFFLIRIKKNVSPEKT